MFFLIVKWGFSVEWMSIMVLNFCVNFNVFIRRIKEIMLCKIGFNVNNYKIIL